jgi:hypothetical protein
MSTVYERVNNSHLGLVLLHNMPISLLGQEIITLRQGVRLVILLYP